TGQEQAGRPVAPCPCPSTPSTPPSPAGSAACSPRRRKRRRPRGRRSGPGATCWWRRRPVRARPLTAFMTAIDGLVRQGLAGGGPGLFGEQPRAGGLPDETTVLYVSPLKALSNDIRLNLEAPLAG